MRLWSGTRSGGIRVAGRGRVQRHRGGWHVLMGLIGREDSGRRLRQGWVSAVQLSFACLMCCHRVRFLV